MNSRLAVLALAAQFSCHSGSAPTTKALPKASRDARPPTLRLPGDAAPIRYDIRLAIDPDKERFEGRATIDLQVREAIDVLWLNAEGLSFQGATRRDDGREVAVDIVEVEHDFVGLRGPWRPGPATVTIRYSGSIDGVNTSGVFRQRDGQSWYAFTQFEDIDARRAFPCFDEPSYKVPWHLSLEVPKAVLALSNTPIASEKATTSTKVVTFKETKPLPSYLIAFAVGPFEVVDVGATRSGVPVRIVTPKGRSSETRWAKATTLPVLALLEDFFGTPYPYEKLDQVAIPQTVGFGAMEHPGLITYSESLLLAKPDELTIDHRRYYVWTAVHELAHQWFGNLVTASWWDDIWLNEAFATWSEQTVIEQWKPEWQAQASGLGDRASAMTTDNLSSARRIREPIEHKDDIGSAFDSITYAKGSRIIRMFETYLGPQRFQRGVRHYLSTYAWKNATAAGFLAALDHGASANLSDAFMGFLTRVGTPEVDVAIDCKSGVSLQLSQRRYRPLGSKASDEATWTFPVCFRYPQGSSGEPCVLLGPEPATLSLQGKCPRWVLPNPGGHGYYRWRFDDPRYLTRLVDTALPTMSPLEKVAFADDLIAQVGAGAAPMELLLTVLPRLAGDRERVVVEAAIDIADGVDAIVAPPRRPAYASFIRRVFGKRARALGWKSRADESDDDTLLRRRLLQLVAITGEDTDLGAQAVAIASEWLEGKGGLAADMIDPALAAAARHGDTGMADRIFAAAVAADTRNQRQRLLRALLHSKTPEVVDQLVEAALVNAIDIRTLLYPLRRIALRNPYLRERLWASVVEHYDRLIQILPRASGAGLADVGAALCDPQRRQEIGEFLGPRIVALPGGEKHLAQSLEALDLCIAQREGQSKALDMLLPD